MIAVDEMGMPGFWMDAKIHSTRPFQELQDFENGNYLNGYWMQKPSDHENYSNKKYMNRNYLNL